MVVRARENLIGAYAFLIGVILAVIIGLSTTLISLKFISDNNTMIYGLLIFLGLIVGFAVNMNSKDSQTFLIAGAVLVIVSSLGMESVTGSFIGIKIASVMKSIFGALSAMFVPATIIVALKTVFNISNI